MYARTAALVAVVLCMLYSIPESIRPHYKCTQLAIDVNALLAPLAPWNVWLGNKKESFDQITFICAACLLYPVNLTFSLSLAYCNTLAATKDRVVHNSGRNRLISDYYNYTLA